MFERYIIGLLIQLFDSGNLGLALEGVGAILGQVAKNFPAFVAWEEKAYALVLDATKHTGTKIDDALLDFMAHKLGIKKD